MGNAESRAFLWAFQLWVESRFLQFYTWNSIELSYVCNYIYMVYLSGAVLASPPRRRQLMNFVLVTTAGIPVLVALGCYLWYFVPPVSGGGGGAQLAGDVDGNPVTLESWVKSHKDNDRELVQGLKGEPYYLISTPDNIKDFALLSVCTHLGCVVPWNKAANKFCCPCHGSQYDENGKVVRGPAPLSLALAHTTTIDGKLALSPWPEQDFRTGLDPWWK